MEKRIFSSTDFDYNTIKIGDYVAQEVVEDQVNMLPPACMRSNCTQMGEPYSHRQDPETGKWRPTFATFKRVCKDVWEYCGHCFMGENVERGTDPIYC